MLVIKKNGTKEDFDLNKVYSAIQKSAKRVLHILDNEELSIFADKFIQEIQKLDEKEVDVQQIHNIVEKVLSDVLPDVAESYKSYRDHRKQMAKMFEEV